jgi:hypothetical protein
VWQIQNVKGGKGGRFFSIKNEAVTKLQTGPQPCCKKK